MYRPTVRRTKRLRRFTLNGRDIQSPTPSNWGESFTLGRLLANRINPTLPPNVCGWRTGGSVAVAVNKIEALTGHRMKFDIRQYFPSIDHERLRRKLNSLDPALWGAVEPWLPSHGLPTGCHFSPALANLYMLDIDLRFPNAIRYCDNIMIVDDDPKRVFLKMQRHLSDVDLAVHEAECDPSEFCKSALRPPKIAPKQRRYIETATFNTPAITTHVGGGV